MERRDERVLGGLAQGATAAAWPLVARLGRRQRTVWTGLKTQLEGSGPARDATEQ
jgi:hypothetical protein